MGVENLDLNDSDIEELKIINDLYEIDSIEEKITDASSILSKYSKCKKIHIQNIKLDIKKINIFENLTNLNNLSELKLISLNKINISNSETKIECKKLKHLEITDCNLENLKLDFSNI